MQALGHGVHVVDTGYVRPQFDAAYLFVEAGRAAFIDTGTTYAVPRLLDALAALGIGRDAVDWVIPTHVHLDHAGGVGALMQALPHARCLVHPRGARHLIDPAVLEAGTRAVYGDAEFERSYGALVPVDAARVQASADGMTVALGGRPLLLLDTPGHARHHHCVWDVASRGCFTGDTFGLSYREFDTPAGPWQLPTTTPVQFEPAALRTSVARLLALRPERMYLPHFGMVGDVQRLGAQLLEQVDAIVAIGERLRHAGDRHAALKQALLQMFRARLRALGSTMADARIAELLKLDCELNAQGMAHWLDREEKR